MARPGRTLVCALGWVLGAAAVAVAQSPAPVTKTSRDYPGVTFVVPESVIADMERAMKDPTNAFWDGTPFPSDIVNGLDAQFSAMAKQYADRKSTLPECLTQALDKLLADLKARRDHLEFKWAKGSESWPDVSEAGGAGQTHYPDRVIWIWNAYRPKYACGPLPSTRTAGLLFHEMVHAARGAYPKCFKPIPLKFKEEDSAEDAAVKVFGVSDVCPVYKMMGTPGYEATRKNLCKCGPECP